MNLAQHAWRSVTGNAKRTGLGTAPLILLVVITLVGVIGAHEGVRSFARQIDDRGGAQILVGAEPRSGLVSEAARLEILQDLARRPANEPGGSTNNRYHPTPLPRHITRVGRR